MSHIAKWKIEEVDNLATLIKEYPVVGIVNMESIPAKIIQRLRRDFRGTALIKMSKKRLMFRAIGKVAREEKSIEDMNEHISKQPAFIFSTLDSFKLYNLLHKNQVPAPAKPNVEAPRDIIIPRGNLGIPAGPLLGELQSIGVKTAIEGGKIAVKADRVVVREGEIISEKVANILNKIGIEPLEAGLELLAAYEDRTVFLPDVLAVSTQELIGRISLAHQQAVSLSISSGFLTTETSKIAVAMAFREAVALALEAAIFEPEVMDKLMAKANMQMLALAKKLSDEALDEELKSVKSAQKSQSVEETSSKEEDEQEEEEKEEKASEEEALGGLGALFG
ncbi:acidic ribosomal protein P0 [archaeon BMS3Bbin15]|nr:acidic ribosomal protein P0 [archaeon BMS3Bbin15]